MKKVLLFLFLISVFILVSSSLNHVQAKPGPAIVIEDQGDGGGAIPQVVEWEYDFSQIYDNYPNSYIYSTAVHRVASYGVLPTLDPTNDGINMQYYFYKSQIITYDQDTYDQLSLFLNVYKEIMNKSQEMYQAQYESLMDEFLGDYIPLYSVLSNLVDNFNVQTFSNSIISVYNYVMSKKDANFETVKDQLINSACASTELLTIEHDEIVTKACEIVVSNLISMSVSIYNETQILNYIANLDFAGLFESISGTITSDFLVDQFADVGLGIIEDAIDLNPALKTMKNFIKINYYIMALYNNSQWASRCAQVSASISNLLIFIENSIETKQNIRLDYVISDITVYNNFSADIPDGSSSIATLSERIKDYFTSVGVSSIFFSNTFKTSLPITMTATPIGGTYIIRGTVRNLSYSEFISAYNNLISSQPTTSPIESKPVGLPIYYYWSTPQTFFR
jgi:hypothetical protein